MASTWCGLESERRRRCRRSWTHARRSTETELELLLLPLVLEQDHSRVRRARRVSSAKPPVTGSANAPWSETRPPRISSRRSGAIKFKHTALPVRRPPNPKQGTAFLVYSGGRDWLPTDKPARLTHR